MEIRLDYKPEGADYLFDLASGRQVGDALRMALTSLSRKIRTWFRRELAAVLGVPQKEIKARIWLVPPAVTGGQITAKVVIGTNRIAPFRLGEMRQTAQGVEVGKDFILPGSFIKGTSYIHHGISSHAKTARKPVFTRAGKKRLPLYKEMVGITADVQEAIDNTFAKYKKEILGYFSREYWRQLERRTTGSKYAVR